MKLTQETVSVNVERVIAVGSTVAYCAKLGAEIGLLIGGAGVARKAAVAGAVLGLAAIVVLMNREKEEGYSYARVINQQR